MSHYLYIDESGSPGNPNNVTKMSKLRVSKVFCLGGILVDTNQKEFFESEHKRLFETYFRDHSNTDFKLHYNELRMGYIPYSSIGRERESTKT